MARSSHPGRPRRSAAIRKSGKPISVRRPPDAGGQGSARLLRQEPHPAGRGYAYRCRRGGQPARRNGVGRSPPSRPSWAKSRRKAASCSRAAISRACRLTGSRISASATCPSIADIFPGLTVRQNLDARHQGSTQAGKWRLEDMLQMFPNLAARADTAAGVMSGGEKQMLTICRTLMGDPELVMIDEPTEGLAPIIVQQVGDLIAEIARRGVAILLVEQKLSIAMRISHPPLCHGPWPHRVRRHAGRTQSQRGGPQGMAGSLTACRRSPIYPVPDAEKPSRSLR